MTHVCETNVQPSGASEVICSKTRGHEEEEESRADPLWLEYVLEFFGGLRHGVGGQVFLGSGRVLEKAGVGVKVDVSYVDGQLCGDVGVGIYVDPKSGISSRADHGPEKYLPPAGFGWSGGFLATSEPDQPMGITTGGPLEFVASGGNGVLGVGGSLNFATGDITVMGPLGGGIAAGVVQPIIGGCFAPF